MEGNGCFRLHSQYDGCSVITRALAVMIVHKLSQNILVSAPERLIIKILIVKKCNVLHTSLRTAVAQAV